MTFPYILDNKIHVPNHQAAKVSVKRSFNQPVDRIMKPLKYSTVLGLSFRKFPDSVHESYVNTLWSTNIANWKIISFLPVNQLFLCPEGYHPLLAVNPRDPSDHTAPGAASTSSIHSSTWRDFKRSWLVVDLPL